MISRIIMLAVLLLALLFLAVSGIVFAHHHRDHPEALVGSLHTIVATPPAISPTAGPVASQLSLPLSHRISHIILWSFFALAVFVIIAAVYVLLLHKLLFPQGIHIGIDRLDDTLNWLFDFLAGSGKSDEEIPDDPFEYGDGGDE